MRWLSKKAPAAQLDLLEAKLDGASQPTLAASPTPAGAATDTPELAQRASTDIVGLPLCIPIGLIDEDPRNPRTEFPDAEIDELADDVRQRGILQPLVVHPADAQGRYRLHFGAKRLRAALRAGLSEVPVVVREAPANAYDQVAESQKRQGLTAVDLARFIKGRVDAGESNAEIARRLGMNLTTVAHHLSLLDLPPALDQVLQAGRCTSPRTLHELSQLHEAAPEEVRALVDSGAEITRSAVAALKADSAVPARKTKAARQTDALARAHAACDRLERALARIDGPPPFTVALPELVALRIRVEDITRKWLWGSDRQTPNADSH
jgi:ParB family transcriptional regulator, chromosome partitioning protein